MKPLIERLYGMRSMICMDVLIEEQRHIAAKTPADKQILKSIYSTNDLDERKLICAKYLGQDEEAEILREWIAKKQKRRQPRAYGL